MKHDDLIIEGGSHAVERDAPQGATAGGGAAVSRLDKRTHLDRGQYRIVLRDYGDGLGEIGWSFVSACRSHGKAGKGLSEQRGAHEDRAVRRARSRIRKLILAIHADHLLTLTYRENVTNFDRACGDLRKFARIMKAKLPGWLYIAVSEQQKRGAWHWHLAVHGRQDVALIRSAWRRVVGEGNIDVNPPKRSSSKRTLALVRYLGKYLAKGFAEGNREINGRRFRASLGISVPGKLITLPPAHYGNVTAYVLNQLMETAGAVGFVWRSDDLLAGWACSWK